MSKPSLNITNSISESIYTSNAKARMMARDNEMRDRSKIEVVIDKQTKILVSHHDYTTKGEDLIREEFVRKLEESRKRRYS